MNIEEVREHFKDALIIASRHGGVNGRIMTEYDFKGIHYCSGSGRYYTTNGKIELYTVDTGFAKIIEYKTKPKQVYTIPIINFDDIEILKGVKVPDGYEIDQVTFKKIEKQLPNSWEEYDKYEGGFVLHNETWDNVPNEYKALRQLELLRDCYNDGWVADWSDTTEYKYCVFVQGIGLIKYTENRHSYFLNFKTADLRDKFLENFKDIIEIAKPLL